MEMHHLKLYYFSAKEVQKDVRRISVPQDCTWEALQEIIQQLFPQINLAEFDLQYRDAEGDSIVMSSAPEWQECLRLTGSAVYTVAEPLRIAIKKRKGANKGKAKTPTGATVVPIAPKEESHPQVVSSFFYDDANNTHEPERLDEVKGQAIKLLELLASEWMANPDPNAMPEELREVVAVRPLPDGTVDTDISLHRLAALASSVALLRLDRAEYQSALELLEASMRLKPCPETQDQIALAHSLLDRKEEPETAPTKAVTVEKDETVELVESPVAQEQVEQVVVAEPAAVVIPEPVPEPVPEVPQKFAEQLNVLRGMGFFDDDASLAILEETKGNVVLAIDRLLA